MGIWILLFLTNLSIPGMLLLFGWMFRDHAPKKINAAFGYRTSRSMKNEDTWQFAQAEFGRLSRQWGWIELPIVLVGMLAVWPGREASIVSSFGGLLCIVLCIPIFIIIWQVERALKRTFDDNGRRISF